MIRLIKKYPLLLLYIYLSVWTSLASTPLTELFRPPLMLSRMYSLLLYVPFAVLILWKLVGDIRGFRKNAVNLIYYLFALYYGALCVYRFAAGMEVKESIYYSIVFFGSVALYCQIRDDRLHMDRDLFGTNFIAILIFVCAYKIIASILCVGWFGRPRLIGNPPINNLYSTSILVLLIPFLLDNLKSEKRKYSSVVWAVLTICLTLIALCASRAIVALAAGLFVVCAALHFADRDKLVKIVASVLCAVLIISVLAGMNAGRVRYALYREFGLFGSNQGAMDDTLPDEPGTTDPTDVPGSDGLLDADDATAQIERSDAMRSTLMKEGIKQVKLNPLFGTGDLYYTQDLGYMKQNLTPHNFLLETIVSYGLIGFVMIAALFVAILLETKILCKSLLTQWKRRIAVLMVFFYFFAFGMVQPSVYNSLLCPLFMLVISHFGLQFTEQAASVKAGVENVAEE